MCDIRAMRDSELVRELKWFGYVESRPRYQNPRWRETIMWRQIGTETRFVSVCNGKVNGKNYWDWVKTEPLPS